MDSTTRTRGWFEYFLFAAIIAETGFAAFVYKTTLRDREFIRFNIFFSVFYAGFLTWTIAQLHKFHRSGKTAEPQPTMERTPGAPVLTTVQLVIVVAVFVTAVATFSWALKLL